MFWKERYELGVARIDEQHKELFERIDAFLKTLRSEGDWKEKLDEVNRTLDFMKAYVVEHFEDEEEYQRSIDFPGYEAHKKSHDDMVNYVLEVSAQYEKSGYDEQLMHQLAGKLMAWLINHVAADDQRIADFASKKEEGKHGN